MSHDPAPGGGALLTEGRTAADPAFVDVATLPAYQNRRGLILVPLWGGPPVLYAQYAGLLLLADGTPVDGRVLARREPGMKFGSSVP